MFVKMTNYENKPFNSSFEYDNLILMDCKSYENCVSTRILHGKSCKLKAKATLSYENIIGENR
jgi:hypothetical protein